jgi:hypothetical protein
MANPYDPDTQTLLEWKRRGGPGRLDRAAARRPRRFAAIYALVFTLGIGAGMTMNAIRVDEAWAWVVTAAVLIPSAAALFVVQHKSALRTSAVMRRWNEQAGSSDGAQHGASGPRENR